MVGRAFVWDTQGPGFSPQSTEKQTSSYQGLVLQGQLLDLIAYTFGSQSQDISVSISESIPDKAKTEAIKSHIFKKSINYQELGNTHPST